MPKLAQDYQYKYKTYSDYYRNETSCKVYPYRRKKSKIYKKKRNPVRFLISCAIVGALLLTFMPYSFKKITGSIFVPTPYKSVKTDAKDYIHPVNNYLSNANYMNMPSFRFSADEKHAQMQTPNENSQLPKLKSQLQNLINLYPSVKSAIYVFDYETGNYIDIKADEIYPTASIIKIPILIDLFKSIELEAISLDDKMALTEYYRTEGSGSIQFKAKNSMWKIDDLARLMITESDNSATNMVMSSIGGIHGVNQSIRDWGIKHTEIQTWLPDLSGNNHSTARELGKMLYNIDNNEEFLTDYSKAKILNYMSHVHNDRLIQAGLGNGAKFYHKTGDIGTMLGDAGIVITPNKHKYIVVILAKRPHNSVLGKEFIVKASEIIYNYMIN